MAFLTAESVVCFGIFVSNELKVAVKFRKLLTSPGLKLAASAAAKLLPGVSQQTGLLPGVLLCLLPGRSVLSRARAGHCACRGPGDHGLWRGAVVSLEGERSGSAGNPGAGVPVTVQSRLLVLGGSVRYPVFKARVVEHVKS